MTPRFCRAALPWLSIALMLFNTLLVLLPMGFFVSAAYGQKPERAYQIGDTLPFSARTYIASQVPSSQGKLVVLDFWASWCSPCVAMIPKMQALQKEFASELVIIPVTYQSKAEVETFQNRLKRQKGYSIELAQLVADSMLHALFPHTSLPHYVWISPEGRVLAITDQKQVNALSIQTILKQPSLALKEKRDAPRVAYRKDKPLVFEGNGAQPSQLFYHSLATGFVSGLSAGVSFLSGDSTKGPRVSFRNVSLKKLYEWAYGQRRDFFHRDRIEVTVRDSTPLLFQIDDYKTWMQAHTYCYELQMPKGASEADLFAAMRQDVARLFPSYQVRLQTRMRRCYALSRLSEKQPYQSKGGPSNIAFDCFEGQGAQLKNESLSKLIANLSGFYQQNSRLPFCDVTAYQGRVDLELRCSLSSVTDLNRALAVYDLAFLEKEVPVSVLVIQDQN